MKSHLLATAATIVALTACAPVPAIVPVASASPGERATVTKVVDGDTIHAVVNGREVDVRIIGVDTPETKKPRTPVQCWGPQASSAAKALLEGKTVTLRADPTQDDVDRYGRSLRYVVLPDGRDYSTVSVAAGSGRAYKVSGPSPQQWPQLVAAQTEAQAAKRGLWGSPCNGGR